MTAINVGDVWKRRVELFDGYDVIQVCARIETEGSGPDEWTITSYPDFGEVIGTTAAGILDYCDLVQSGDPEQAAWETEIANGLE
jgi:hypothetical protein